MVDNPSISVTTTAADNHYHAKRPHRKTRTGCRNCKSRKVKCDEGRPACRACTVRKESCVYIAVRRVLNTMTTSTTSTSTTSTASTSSPTSSPSPGREPSPTLALVTRPAATVPQQPLFIPSGHGELDMRLLWFYTTATYASFSTGGLRERNVDAVLKVNVVQHAFANPFLMHSLLGLSAMHANHLGLHHLGVTQSHEIHYRARAFETYRKAVDAADPATFPALLACSLLLCGLSTHVFRGEDAQPLSILDWLGLWKGIGTIIEITRLPPLFRSGINALLTRPNVDLDASARCVPSYLLFMVASIREADPDFSLAQPYYKALQYLGSLYLEVKRGLSHMLLLRVCTFPTFLPWEVIDAARERRPRALVILAHYLVFVKFRVKSCWWMDNIAEHEIPSIYSFLGSEWRPLLRVPMAALLLDSDRDVVRLLLGDPDWTQPSAMEEEPLAFCGERERTIRAAVEDQVSTEVEEYRQNHIPGLW